MSDIKLYELYRQVDDAIKEGNYGTVVEICNKIIAQDAKEVDAIRCKCVALIQQDKFDEAVTAIDKSSIAKELMFEKAYALYRLRKYKEALDALKNTTKSTKTQELEAQIMFRLEQYDRSVEIYETMLTESKTGSAELLTNLTAALTAASRSKRCLDVLAKYKQTLRKSFELTYNGACCYVEMGDLDTGDQYLQAAQSLCEDTLKKEGASEEEIQDELNIILTQQAYTQQRRGKETAEIYEKVLKTKPSDLSVQAVCMNNLAVIRKGDKVNSYNKLKQVSSNPSVIEKLSTKQRKSIGFNRSILLILLGKMEESRQLANELQKEFPQSEFLPIVNAAIYHAEKNYNQAANVLKEYIKQNPKGSIEVKLSLAQIYLQQRNMTELNNLLQSNVDQINNSPALLNKLAALYERTGDVESALKFLDESVNKLSKSDENYRQLVKRNADFKMKYKKYKDAAEWYNKILEVNKNDKEALPLSIIATAHYNQDQAEKLETKLPQLAEERQDIDVDRLETIPVITTRRYRAQENQVAKVTKKRKRHNKKPKHFDPRIPPNPERWLPRWQRTKGGKRGKKGPQKGPAQGAAHLVKEEERKQAAAQEKLAQPKDASKNQAPPPGSKNKPVLNVNKKRRRK